MNDTATETVHRFTVGQDSGAYRGKEPVIPMVRRELPGGGVSLSWPPENIEEIARANMSDAEFALWKRHLDLSDELHSADVRFYGNFDDDGTPRLSLVMEFVCREGDETEALLNEYTATIGEFYGVQATVDDTGWGVDDDDPAPGETRRLYQPEIAVDVWPITDEDVRAIKGALIAALLDDDERLLKALVEVY